jgi:5-methylcytosine-specific restriction endonuclease McrA
MAEPNYVRLAAACHCGEPVKLWTGRGRKPKYCGDHNGAPPKIEQQQKECPACRGFFTPNAKGGQEHKYCSRLCAVRLRRGNEPRQLWPLKCAACEAGFESLSEKAMYCSNRCKHAAWVQANPNRVSLLRQRERRREPVLCAYFTGYCACGKALGSRRRMERCSACTRAQALAAGRLAALAWSEAKHKAAGLVVRCVGCCRDFCPLYGTKVRSTCPCCEPGVRRERSRAAKDKRDKRIKSAERETVVARKVFDRDGWMCRLCGIATPKELRGTYENNAPEMDHVVPVARGGAHTYANTQCLCRSCNGWKSARTMEEALAALAA